MSRRTKKIFDEFTHIENGNKRYIARNEARGLCRYCPSFAVEGIKTCKDHQKKNSEYHKRYRTSLKILANLGKEN